MITKVPGCLKDQSDLHQGGTTLCPRIVYCVLLLKKKITLQKCHVLKVKSFPLYPAIHKAESKQSVAPKSSFKYRPNPAILGPSRGFQSYSSESTCPNGFVHAGVDKLLLQSFCITFILASSLRT